MTIPSLSVVDTALDQIEADVLVLGVTAGDDTPVLHSDHPGLTGLRETLGSIGVTGARDELVRVPATGVSARSIALVGLGKGAPSTEALRNAAGVATRLLTGVDTIAFGLPAQDSSTLEAILEGAAIGAYSYTAARGRTAETTKMPAHRVIVASDIRSADVAIERAAAIAEAMHIVRDLVHTPPDRLFPESFAAIATDLLKDHPVEVSVLAEDELEAGGYGGLLGVGKGSVRGPRLVRLDYAPAGADRHLALVGKGITFDSGGLSLKPAASMVGMKYDMAGAASVLAVVHAAARLALPVRITGWLCLAENMPSGTAMRPNDVITTRGGTTVEVLNTDAEGRLVLADGLTAAREDGPDAIIDIATLTGAATVALGTRYSAAMGDRTLVDSVCNSAERVGEKFWPMPLPEELRPALNSDIADIANARIGNTAGGMLLAGVFLREFANPAGASPVPWAHLDIAGTAHNPGSGHGFTAKGPTGAGVRTLLALADEFSGA